MNDLNRYILMPVFLMLLLSAFVIVVTGCASLEKQAGNVVRGYCENTTDTDQSALRERLDTATDPHTVRINCERETGAN